VKVSIKACLLAFTAAIPASAFCQTTAPVDAVSTAAGNTDIVVTARKREENLQDVPVAITAFSSEDIKSARIEGIADVAKLSPGLVFTPLFGRQNQLPIIRGAAQTFGQLNVGVFLDGIYLSGKGGVDLELNDLERIEVVRGPQSALYGRNTFAGAINYVTARPGDALGGRVEGTVGDHGLYKVQASIDGPLSDTLRFRIGGFSRKFDGFYRSSIDGGRVDFEKSYGGIATLEFKPTDAFTLTLRGSYSKSEDGQPPSSVIRNNSAPGLPAGSPAGTVRNLLYIGQVPEIAPNGVTVNTTTAPGQPSRYGDREDTIRASATIEYDFGNATMTAITAYARRDAEYTFDGDNTICSAAIAPSTTGCPNFGFPFAPAIPVGSSRFALSSSDGYLRDISQELRFASSGKQTIDWLIGFFYYNNRNAGIDRGLSPLTTSGPTAYSSFNTNYSYPDQKVDTQSYAAFGSLTLHANEKLSLTGELRYEYEEQQFRQRPTYVTSAPRSTLVFAVPTVAQALALAQYDAAIAAGVPISPIATTAAQPFGGSVILFPTPATIATNPLFSATAFTATDQSFHFATPRVIVNYQYDPGLLLYASYARGAKTGGFNTGLNVFPNQRTYQPESSTTYEAGIKSDWLNNHLRLNLTGFFIDWKDQQAACQNPISAGGSSTNRTYTCNVAASKIYGLEFEFVARFNRMFSVSGNYAYTSARYSRFVDDSLAAVRVAAGLPALNFAGKHLPYVPDHKFVISPTIDIPAGDDLNIQARADIQHQTRTYVRADNLQSFGEKTVVDLRLSARYQGFSLQLFANNVFDDRTPVAGVRFFDSTNFSVASPLVTGADGRQIGATLGMKF
jgi:iron complex outermembrane recepter protein